MVLLSDASGLCHNIVIACVACQLVKLHLHWICKAVCMHVLPYIWGAAVKSTELHLNITSSV